MSAKPYFNTTRLTGAELREAVQSANKQEAAVLAIFDRWPAQPMSPSQVWRIGCDLGARWLLTSVRRSITVLTKKGSLTKLDTKVSGLYKRPEFQWRSK